MVKTLICDDVEPCDHYNLTWLSNYEWRCVDCGATGVRDAGAYGGDWIR